MPSLQHFKGCSCDISPHLESSPTMTTVALSPISPESPSPMLTSVTPTLDLGPSRSSSGAVSVPLKDLDQEGPMEKTLLTNSSRGTLTAAEPNNGQDVSRTKKPPPLHAGADWKVVLHLPEIEKWLRATSDRVTQLTHSASQDTDSRHVDVHLMQLKDICEDISDHVEQIHALLETEFSLKLLSYSVNIIVDIRTVQLLWHQLRVSVLVLKERLLQGLQDSNGNYTRQTDILQAFSQDQHQTRLDALTEVDDCGQLTIRCSQDYLSLDCGITAFELSVCSPSDEPETCGIDPTPEDSSQEIGGIQDSNREPPVNEEREGTNPAQPDLQSAPADLPVLSASLNQNHSSVLPTMQCSMPNQGESSKRILQRGSHSTDASPTHPSLPKRAALLTNQEATDSRGDAANVQPLFDAQIHELSRSTPSLVEPPDRSRFWLELDSVYPQNVSQSCESLQMTERGSAKYPTHRTRSGGGGHRRLPRRPSGVRSSKGTLPGQSSMSQEEGSGQIQQRQKETRLRSKGDSESSSPSPLKEQLHSSDTEASREESDPQLHPTKATVWIVKQQGEEAQVPASGGEHWYGSEEFLALPAQLHKTEMLTLKLESLTKSIPHSSGDGTQVDLQDVDDWELTDFTTDWDVGESGDSLSGEDALSPMQQPYRRKLARRFSPTSSSDIAPSLDESLESGPFSDLQSDEDEGRRSADPRLQQTAPPVDGSGCVALVQQLLEDIQCQKKDPDMWRKIEGFVQKLDGFISWLQEALGSTENWTQPRQDLDSLKVYLDTHLSFKLSVDGHSALKLSIMEEGRALLGVLTSHHSALKDILHMVSGQWDQLQRQIRRQHGWMLRTLRCIQARLFYTNQSQELLMPLWDYSANRRRSGSAEGQEMDLVSSQFKVQRDALERMAIKLSRLEYPPSANSRANDRETRSNSLQEFESEYQELWDWLMDLDAMVTDSHHLLMSEDQRHHLFKSSHCDMMMMEGRRTGLLSRAAALRSSGTALPTTFHVRMHKLTQTWKQLEKVLSEHSGPRSFEQKLPLNVNPLLLGGGGVPAEEPPSVLSPLTTSLLEQLEARIKELKAWLRDTELLIFNSCQKQDKNVTEQLQSFQCLSSEIRARRRGVSSVLKLCQKLLLQSQSGPMAEVGPDAEQHQEALQLLSINLQRRWEAIVMQALQWQNRLKRKLGEQQVSGNFLDPGLMELHHISPVTAGPLPLASDDSWEWDETDMTIREADLHGALEPDLTHDLPTSSHLPSDCSPTPERRPIQSKNRDSATPNCRALPPDNNNVYQVFSLHNVELYTQPQFPLPSSLLHQTKAGKRKHQVLLKSLSKDSSFSSIESLPDILGGLMSSSHQQEAAVLGRRGGRSSGQSENSRRSDCESGIVSDTGDTETLTTNSESQGKEEDEGEEEEVRKDESVVAGFSTDRQRSETEMTEKGWSVNRQRGNEEKWRRNRKRGGNAVEILINGHGILTPPDSDSDLEGLDVTSSAGRLEDPGSLIHHQRSPVVSQRSSLESLLGLSGELFPSKEALHRSFSLESCLISCYREEAEEEGSFTCLGDPDLQGGGPTREPGEQRSFENICGGPSSGELSQRTLDLLKRLENIQSPLRAKMTRSVSDMTLRTSSSGNRRFSASPRVRRSPVSTASVIQESSAATSPTELSSNEDCSLGSEDFNRVRTPQQLFLHPNMLANRNSYRSPNNNRDEADAASLSMVVNISCTCTDEDEEDSDLLSSSTLTLTEEELGVREEENRSEEKLSGASSGNDIDDDDEEDMEGCYMLGFEYMKKELQSWIRSPRSSAASRTEAVLWDELQCGGMLSSGLTSSSLTKDKPLNSTAPKLMESRSKARQVPTKAPQEEEVKEEKGRSIERSFVSQFVDDVENGNAEPSSLKGKDEDDLLREESSVFTKKGECQQELYLHAKAGEPLPSEGNLRASVQHMCFSPSCEVLPFQSKPASSLVGQLRGELPCQSVCASSPPSLSPVEDFRSHKAPHPSSDGGRKAITIQEKFKFSSIVTEEAKKEVRAKGSSLPLKKRATCCRHRSSPPHPVQDSKKENERDFVMEIIDMTSVALKRKENQAEEPDRSPTSSSDPDQSPASAAQIRDKVLELSHRPLHLRKGDFYSYLSLSSHDSDCGEVSQCIEDRSSTPQPYSVPAPAPSTPGLQLFTSTTRHSSQSPPPCLPFGAGHSSQPDPPSPGSCLPPSPDIQDEETLFPACTEEVYLGPPLCYSMVLSKKPSFLLRPGVEPVPRRSFFPSSASESACLQGPGSRPVSPPPLPPTSSRLEEEQRDCTFVSCSRLLEPPVSGLSPS
ncbi:A-kinase anchor protein 6 isoform X1 [Oryzias latipes]|uniref:A-kinase anchor protein 6 isoform X1 n=2 Tax=Oryzias latipes TaxID=8090 RepID=UPI0009DB5266|nr:A-kinase anchor protein 6 isoform X1 [Oryzias latipes]